MRRSLLLALLCLGLACNCTSSTINSNARGTAKTSADKTPQDTGPAEDVFVGIVVPEADPREPRLSAGMRTLLEREHVKPHAIDDDVAKKAFALYLDRLDPGKLLLLAPHVEAFGRRATTLDDELRAGDFHTARLASALLASQRKQIAQKVDALLKQPFDFTKDEWLESDPEKREWAKDAPALEDRWRRLLKQQVLERIARMDEIAKALEEKRDPKQAVKGEDGDDGLPVKLEPPPPTFEGREAKAREELQKSYAGRFSRMLKPEPLEAAELFLNAFASAYDPHSLYLAPADQENFDIEMSGSLEGIGAVLSEDDHYILVREIVPGGAAWRQGLLEAGDLILAVTQVGGEPVDVADMRINDVVKMIRGPKGTRVTLTVKKPDDRVLSLEITRDVVVVEATYARGAILDLGPKHEPVGYVYLPSFYGNTRSARGQTPERDATSDVRALLTRFAGKKLGGIVLDLRGNGGGLLDHATGIAGLLVDRGPVVEVQNARGKQQVLGDDEPGVSFEGEVVVLVDRFSASASEILAGALQDYGRALVVGTGPTHGKGTVQALIDLDRVAGPSSMPLGVAKLTIQQFFLVDGESTQWRGVQPDVVLPDPASHIESGERYLDNAIPFSAVRPLPVKPWPNGHWSKAALAQVSTTRQTAQPVFEKVKARGNYLAERQKQSRIPLAREAWLEQRKKDRKALEDLDLKLEEGDERFSVQAVEYRPDQADEKVRAAADKRLAGWKKTLARDPWLEEALYLLADMQQGAKVAAVKASGDAPN
jgi:carboxyl-terminal processing protease